MNKYYFTFTAGHRMGKYVQPVFGMSIDEAILKMQNVYGKSFTDFSTDLHLCEFSSEKFSKNLIELRPLYTQKVMTFGEMRQLTERFNQIIGAGQTFKVKRLDKFIDDVDASFDINKDKCAFRMYLSATEAVAN